MTQLAPTTTVKDLFEYACKKGAFAGTQSTPTPMVATSVGLDDKPLPHTKTYVIMDGLCGFAWVTIRPARGAFVNYLKARGIGHAGYYGGYEISTNAIEKEMGVNFGQSYERKMEAAEAFAGVLQAWGINAVAEGRLD